MWCDADGKKACEVIPADRKAKHILMVYGQKMPCPPEVKGTRHISHIEKNPICAVPCQT